MASTRSVSSANFSIRFGSEWDPTTTFMPSSLSFSAFSGERTTAVTSTFEKLGDLRSSLRTEPPM